MSAIFHESMMCTYKNTYVSNTLDVR